MTVRPAIRIVQPHAEIRSAWGDPWAPVAFLRPREMTQALQPTIPTAVLDWEYGELNDGSGATFRTYAPQKDLAGHFIKITQGAAPPTTDEMIPDWYGIILAEADRPGGDDADVPAGTEALLAYGLEVLLDRAAITGTYIEGAVAPVRIDALLPFNLRGDSGLSLQGNRSQARYTGPGGLESYVFSEDGEVWNAADVIEYLVAWFAPAEMRWILATDGALDNLDAQTDVFMPGRNVRHSLGQILDRRRGHAWAAVIERDDAGDERPAVKVFSDFDEAITIGGVTIAANAETTTLEQREPALLEIRRTLDATFDRVLVRGGPIIACGTLSYAADQLAAAWSGTLQTAYDAADAVGRTAEKFAAVYRAFRARTDKMPAGPSCDDDGRLNPDVPAPEFWPGKGFLRQLPLAESADDTGAGPLEHFRRPFIVAPVTVNGETVYARLDQLAEWFASSPSMSLHMMDGEPGFILGASPNYLLAKDVFAGANSGSWIASIDYRLLEATVAWACDEYLTVAADLAGASHPGGLRTLVIDVPEAQAWYLLAGTIVDVQAGVRITGGPTELRNDADQLRAVAALAKAWYQRERSAVRAVWPRLAWSRVGVLLSQVHSRYGATEVNTIITRVRWDLDRATTEMETDFAELDFVAMGAGRRGGPALRAAPHMASAGGGAIAAPADPNRGNLPARLAQGVPCPLGTHAAPYEMLPEDPADEPEAAQADTWDIDDPPQEGEPPEATDGLVLKVHTRTVYDEAGDQILYGYYRELTFDSLGRLVAVSGETQYTIDEPEVCP